jgi:hypothetical protein
MAPLSRYAADAFAVLGIGVFCLPILLLLMPSMEMARSEARISMTYNEVRRLRSSMVTARPAQAATLPERDRWGQPYQVRPLANGDIRVLSPGPNQSSPRDGLDQDDIYSDMPESPGKAIIDRKKRQSLIAVGVSLGAWLLLASLYLRWHRRPSPRRALLNRFLYGG